MLPKKLPKVIESLEGREGTLMLQTRETPDGRRFELIVAGHYAMAASDGDTEKVLSSFALGKVSKRENIRVLIGGLGLGLTLRETLRDRRVSEVWVAEIGEAVIRWNKTHLAEFNGNALKDSRVKIFCGDVMELIRKKKRFFDAVILDVDNGPSFLMLERNDLLYTISGLKKLRKSLVRDGVLGIWAYRPEPDLEMKLEKIFGGFDVKLIRDPALRQDLPPTAIYAAKKG